MFVALSDVFYMIKMSPFVDVVVLKIEIIKLRNYRKIGFQKLNDAKMYVEL